MSLSIDNRTARRLWLQATRLSAPPTGTLDAAAIVRDLGYVQLDSIQNIVRAHHHILWSRNQHYRPRVFDRLLQGERAVFEHYSHDACILPMEVLPMWRRQFTRMGERAAAYRQRLDADDTGALLARIGREGPLCSADFDSAGDGPRAMWQRPPHKQTLDHLWYAGVLATHSRRHFNKYYDLAERVFPATMRDQLRSDDEQIDWLCRQALARLVVGSAGDICRFWEAASVAEVKRWIDTHPDAACTVGIEHADGTCVGTLARPDIASLAARVPAATTRLRILSPFDPAVRDRRKLQRLFGFDYRIEIFVPAAQRRYGYYVYPLLEGDRFVGRLQARADRRAGVLRVERLWADAGVRWTPSRGDKLDAELARLRRLAGLEAVEWICSGVPAVADV